MVTVDSVPSWARFIRVNGPSSETGFCYEERTKVFVLVTVKESGFGGLLWNKGTFGLADDCREGERPWVYTIRWASEFVIESWARVTIVNMVSILRHTRSALLLLTRNCFSQGNQHGSEGLELLSSG